MILRWKRSKKCIRLRHLFIRTHQWIISEVHMWWTFTKNQWTWVGISSNMLGRVNVEISSLWKSDKLANTSIKELMSPRCDGNWALGGVISQTKCESVTESTLICSMNNNFLSLIRSPPTYIQNFYSAWAQFSSTVTFKVINPQLSAMNSRVRHHIRTHCLRFYKNPKLTLILTVKHWF